MKKNFFILVFFLSYQGVAQNVGIGTSNPHSSAVLDVNSNNKGLLIPRVNLQNTGDTVTIHNPASSLLVYNTNAIMPEGTGFYFNNGTPSLPLWKKLAGGNFSIPYTNTSNSGSPLFSLTNSANGIIAHFSSESSGALPALVVSSQSTLASAIHAFNGNSGLSINYKSAVVGESSSTGTGVAGLSALGYGLYGESQSSIGVLGTAHASNASGVRGVTSHTNGHGISGFGQNGGIGGYFASAGGVALKTSGTLSINATGASAGKVLMTDAGGNAHWDGAIAFATRGSATVAPPNTSYILPQTSEDFDIDGNFLLNSSIINPNSFVAPIKGIYEFNGSVTWIVIPGSSFTTYTEIKVNGNIRKTEYFQVTSDADITTSIHHKLLLNEGDIVTFSCKHTSPQNESIFSSFFSGNLLFRQ
jgi:hypothetical protein